MKVFYLMDNFDRLVDFTVGDMSIVGVISDSIDEFLKKTRMRLVYPMTLAIKEIILELDYKLTLIKRGEVIQ